MAVQPRVRTGEMAGPKTRWAWAVSTVCGVGFLRPGPGTYGSVIAVLLWLGAGRLLQSHTLALNLTTAIAALLASLIGIPAATRVAREAGREDPGFVVIDEVAGQWLALIFFPADWQHAAVGLLLFRAFDILKPPPVRQLEALPEGAGIMLDDLAAGVLAAALGVACFYLIHRFR